MMRASSALVLHCAIEGFGCVLFCTFLDISGHLTKGFRVINKCFTVCSSIPSSPAAFLIAISPYYNILLAKFSIVLDVDRFPFWYLEKSFSTVSPTNCFGTLGGAPPSLSLAFFSEFPLLRLAVATSSFKLG